MRRSRDLGALVRLPALARNGNGRAARRYLRERTKAVACQGPPEATPRHRRRDDVRELTVTSMQRPQRDPCSRETYVPCLRLAGRWLEALLAGSPEAVGHNPSCAPVNALALL